MQSRPRRISLQATIWLLPLIFLIHDTEEIFAIPGWLEANRQRLELLASNPFTKFVLSGVPTTSAQFSVSVAFIFCLCVLASYLAARNTRPGFGLDLYVTIVVVMVMNTVSHVGSSLLFGDYTPGVITAPIILMPYSFYALSRLREAKLLERKFEWKTVTIGLVVALPVILVAHAVGRLVG